MDIKEVLNLPVGTKVKCENAEFEVVDFFGMKLLHKDGAMDNSFMNASLEVVSAEYELIRKKLSFFEAMKLVDEGKTVEDIQGVHFRKRGYILQHYNTIISAWIATDLLAGMIANSWYEVIE